jgi:probable rRNA maturation factor
MDEDTETDVLSFPAGPPLPGPESAMQSVGEIIVCIQVCKRSASARRVPLHEEVARMLIHGALHLLGFDHGTARERKKMTPRERRYLAWYRRRGLEVVAGRR